MFEATLDLDPTELLDTMREAQRTERLALAQRILAAGRLCQMRMAKAEAAHEIWCVEDWDVVAAEIGAELGMSRFRAAQDMRYAHTLLERFPKLGAKFATGVIDFRVITTIHYRTALIIDPDVLTRLDAQLASRAPHWNKLSKENLKDRIDWLVIQLDPDAIRISREIADRRIEVEMTTDGLADISGTARSTDAVAFDRRLDQLAETVCSNDPRTKEQRRADALGPLSALESTMACNCGRDDCLAAANAGSTTGEIVIHVLAEADAVQGDGTMAGYLPGYGALPAETLKDVAKRARLRPIVHPKDSPPEPRYRPSVALADFVRWRDLTCRFPGCDCPAEKYDLDHTIPYPPGPTHPSNIKLLCRFHHLMKTFFTGSGGWCDQQLADGTVIWTAPSGRTYSTTPLGAALFPQLAVPTGELALPSMPVLPDDKRCLAMPKRRRSRAADRAYRVKWERAANRARYEADPPPF